MSPLCYDIFDSPIGILTVVADTDALCRVMLPSNDHTTQEHKCWHYAPSTTLLKQARTQLLTICTPSPHILATVTTTGHTIPMCGMACTGPHLIRPDLELCAISCSHWATKCKPCRRGRKRSQPTAHRITLPPCDWQQWRTHRLQRRTTYQTLPAVPGRYQTNSYVQGNHDILTSLLLLILLQ